MEYCSHLAIQGQSPQVALQPYPGETRAGFKMHQNLRLESSELQRQVAGCGPWRQASTACFLLVVVFVVVLSFFVGGPQIPQGHVKCCLAKGYEL